MPMLTDHSAVEYQKIQLAYERSRLEEIAYKIHRKRLCGEISFEETDRILRERGITPNTIESAKYMERWDYERAEEEFSAFTATRSIDECSVCYPLIGGDHFEGISNLITSNRGAVLYYFNKIFSARCLSKIVSQVMFSKNRTFFDWLFAIDDNAFVMQVATRIIDGVLLSRIEESKDPSVFLPCRIEEKKKISYVLNRICYSGRYRGSPKNTELGIFITQLVISIDNEIHNFQARAWEAEQRRAKRIREAIGKIENENGKKEEARRNALDNCHCYGGYNHVGGPDCMCPCHHYRF